MLGALGPHGRITLPERLCAKPPPTRGEGLKLNGKKAIMHIPPIKGNRVRAFLRMAPVGVNGLNDQSLAFILGCSKAVVQRIRKQEREAA
jgi:hypothetical protein